MASTHTCLHFHLVFSTKNRSRLISSDFRAELHRYLGGTVNALGGVALAVGGVDDHVHLLVGLKATHALSTVLQELKKASSAWIHDRFELRRFAWQEGYGGFTVSRSNLDAVRRYIEDQPAHHEQVTFQEEYLALLRQHQIEFDERYLW